MAEGMDPGPDGLEATVATVVGDLLAEATRTGERRLLVLAGARATGYAAAGAVLDAPGRGSGVDLGTVTLSERDVVGNPLPPDRADELLGTTHGCVVVDGHDACRPNALGRAAGAVDGGGLLVLLTPDLETWPDRRDEFDETLAVPPFGRGDVTGRFRRRLVDTLRAHRGVAIVDVDDGRVVDDGLTDPAPRLAGCGGAAPTASSSSAGRRGAPQTAPSPIAAPFLPAEHDFPREIYEACLTADQRDAVLSCEALAEPGRAVVLESDRGRGKSSAAGLGAAALAASGDDVLVTAPGPPNAAALFERAEAGLRALGVLASGTDPGPGSDVGSDETADDGPSLRATGGGRVRFLAPVAAQDATADVLIVDEAAALPVRTLSSLLALAPSACFATTIHGYEGAGRGFDVRFRHHLEDARSVETVALAEPIRYAPADPVEVWCFRALLLDAAPPVEALVADATPEAVAYERLDRDALCADESRLREAFGLLVAAHYRTEPDDLARFLDAPNVALRALTFDGHVVSVAMLAREGDLPAALRREAYEGARIRGNMLPDVLTSQLRDPDAGSPVGLRVMRIATHHAVRSRGLGSALLGAIESEFDADRDRPTRGRFGPVDYLGVGYGATPALVDFWADAGYATVHLSTTRNDASGEYSALMLRPLSAAGRELADRHAAWFRRRVPDVLADALDDADPDVVRAALAATDGAPAVALTDAEWRVVASAAFGPGLYDVAPGPFRTLALRALVDGALADPAAERLLVAKVLQARPWDEVVEELGYVSRRTCMRALGEAFRPLVDRYGGDAAREEADRYREER